MSSNALASSSEDIPNALNLHQIMPDNILLK